MNDASASAQDHPSTNPEASSSDDAFPAAAEGSGGLEERDRMQQKQRTTFLDDLIRNIDIMIYCELSILYYMDCSLFKFLVRAIPYWFYFTPKPSILPPPPRESRAYVGAIFGTNIFCMLLHLLFKPLVAGEAARGYLHGGLIIDFVGQHSPLSRIRLLGLDILTLTLQLLMMTISLEKERVKGQTPTSDDGGAANDTTTDEGRGQNYDAEERGMLSSDAVVTGDIELDDLQHASHGRTGRDEGRGSDEILASITTTSTPHGHPLDTFYSGEHLVADLNILDAIRTQWNFRAAGADSNISSASSGMQNAATLAGRRLTFTLNGRSIG